VCSISDTAHRPLLTRAVHVHTDSSLADGVQYLGYCTPSAADTRCTRTHGQQSCGRCAVSRILHTLRCWHALYTYTRTAALRTACSISDTAHPPLDTWPYSRNVLYC